MQRNTGSARRATFGFARDRQLQQFRLHARKISHNQFHLRHARTSVLLRDFAHLSQQRLGERLFVHRFCQRFDVVAGSPAEFRRTIERDLVRFGKLVRDAGIQPE